MQTLHFEAVIDESRTLSLALPGHVRPGMARVTVTVDTDTPSADPGAGPSPAEMAYEKLLRFGDGRRLDGISIKELVAEGRRCIRR